MPTENIRVHAGPSSQKRREATRREVRRGMLTMMDALLAHVDELEARLAKLERKLWPDRNVDGGTDG